MPAGALPATLLPDPLRLAIGTLTAVRVPPPRRVTRTTAGRAMLLAPLVGAALGLLAAAVPAAVGLLAHDRRTSGPVDLLGAALAVGAIALLTRGLHLDGLADTADGLGVKGAESTPDEVAATRDRRLAVMRAPDTGAFGVVAVVLVVLVQVTAIGACVGAGVSTTGLVVAAATGRLAATWGSTTSVPSARPEGLGATVAGSVPRVAAFAVTVAVLVGAGLLGAVGTHDAGRAASLVAAVLVGLAVGAAVLRHCVRRLGGVTGDVLGAVVEITTTAVLVVVALLAAT